MKNTAIVLAGGRGSRMQSDIPKQYMDIEGRTVLFYSLKQFQDCSLIDDIILVAGVCDIEFCRKTYIEEHNMTKIKHIVCGGRERYESVMNGLTVVDEGYVFIHDGARPCITQSLITSLYEDVKKYRATVAAVPVKDTVRISDDNGNAISTPKRSNVWLIQTPQVFETELIKKAYANMQHSNSDITITDDAMMIEQFTDEKVHLTQGDYLNIKITTPEDIEVVKGFLKKLKKL